MIDVRFEEPNHRSAAYAGGKEVGECTFIPANGEWEINHTFVEPSHRGGDIAPRLVNSVVDAARAAGVKLRATCSYAHKVLRSSAKYADIFLAD